MTQIREVHGNITANRLGLEPNLKKSRDLLKRVDFTPNPLYSVNKSSGYIWLPPGEESTSGHQEVTLPLPLGTAEEQDNSCQIVVPTNWVCSKDDIRVKTELSVQSNADTQ